MRHRIAGMAFLACLWPAAASAQMRPPTPTEERRSVTVRELELTVTGALDGFALDVRTEPVAPGVTRAVLMLTRATPAPPPRLTIRWSQPSVDMAGMWTPDAGRGRTIVPDFVPTRLRSTLTAAAPVLTIYGRGEQNRLTVAAEEAVNPVLIAAKLREEDVRVYGSVERCCQPNANRSPHDAFRSLTATFS